MSKNMPANIIILGIVSLLADISSEMVYPLIPYFLVYVLGTNIYFLGIIEGIAESTASLLKVFFGVFSDRIQKRKIFAIFGYGVSSAGKLLLAMAASWPMVLSSRFVDRTGKGIRTAPRDALISESAAAGKRGAAFGLHRAMDTAGAVIGAGLAFLVLLKFSDNIRGVFYLALIPAILSVIAMVFIREGKKADKKEAKVSIKSYFSLKQYPRQLKIFLLISFIFTIGNSSNLFLILKAMDIGFLPIYALLLYMIYSVSHSLSSYPAAKLSDRIGRKAILAIGYFLFGIIYLGFAFIGVKAAYWALFLVYGLYSGLTEGVEKAFVADNSPENLKATALGMHATVAGITLLPASVLAGLLWQFAGPSAPFYFSGLTGFISTILILKYIE